MQTEVETKQGKIMRRGAQYRHETHPNDPMCVNDPPAPCDAGSQDPDEHSALHPEGMWWGLGRKGPGRLVPGASQGQAAFRVLMPENILILTLWEP